MEFWLPRSVLYTVKIPRRALSEVIRAVCLVLDIAEGHARPRWRWVFHPAMSVILGLLIFLLALASLTPILGMAAHLGPAFIMSVGLAERDGLAVMIGALAGVALLARATMSLVPGRPLLTTTRNWLHACFKRMRLRSAAWLLDRQDQGLGALLRVRWSNLLLLFAADVSVGVDPSVYSRQTLRRRVHRIRAAQQLRLPNQRDTEMELEQFYAFDVDEPLNCLERREIILREIDDNAAAFGKEVTHSWHKREGEDFLRIDVDPVVVEIVFASGKIELYGAAPPWARLLFTTSHKDQLRERIEQLLIARASPAQRSSPHSGSRSAACSPARAAEPSGLIIRTTLIHASLPRCEIARRRRGRSPERAAFTALRSSFLRRVALAVSLADGPVVDPALDCVDRAI